MAGTQTLQVKRAIARLRAAGLPRNAFWCRVERCGDGSYGNAQIFLRIRNSKARRYAKALLGQGFGLLYIRSEGHPPYMLVKDDWRSRGKVVVWDARKEDDYA